MIKLIILLYYMFYTNLFFFIKKLVFLYLEDLIILIIIFIILINLVLILKLLNTYFVNKIHRINIDYYIYNKYNYYISVLVLVLFFIFYFLNFRFFIFFSKRNNNLNIFDLKKKYLNYCYFISADNYLLIFFLLSIILMTFYVFFFFLFQVLIFFSKNYFLKVHYYKFRLNNNYNLLLDKLKEIETFLFDSLGGYYLGFIFFRRYIMILILILIFLYSVFFFNGNLIFFLDFIPYYGFYQFLLSIYIFLVTKLKIDFEILVMESYFKNIEIIMEKNETKKLEYKRYLLSNFSKYKFEDSVYFFFFEKTKKNYLLIQTNRYTINKFPNDFFTRIKNHKPYISKD